MCIKQALPFLLALNLTPSLSRNYVAKIFKAEMLHTKEFSVSSRAWGSGEEADTPLSRICTDLDNFASWTTVEDKGWLKVSHESVSASNGARRLQAQTVLTSWTACKTCQHAAPLTAVSRQSIVL